MKRDKSLDLVRCVACILIVVYHFFVEQKDISFGISTSNNSLGGLAVSLFFIISGAALYLSMSKGDNRFHAGTYIYKRFKAIYPAFWTAYIIAFLYRFFLTRQIDPSIPIHRIWLSITGMDGLFLYAAPNFYLVGDWFIGAIIITYMYYPLVKYLIDRFPKVMWAVVLVLFIVYVQTYFYQMELRHNPFSFVIEVVFGIYYAKYFIKEKRYNKTANIIVFIASVVVFVFLLLFYFDNEHIRAYAMKIMGIALFLIVVQFKFIMNNAAVNMIVCNISANSYYIFLVHHFIYSQLMMRFSDVVLSKVEYAALFMLYIILIIPFTLIVKVVSKKFINLIELIPKKKNT